MPVLALVERILRQLKHDKRTLALLFVGPLMILTLLNLILSDSTMTLRVAAVNCPMQYIENMEKQDLTVVRMTEGEAYTALQEEDIIAAVELLNDKLYIKLDGSNASKSAKTLVSLQTAQTAVSVQPNTEVEYLYGYEDMKNFDNFGAALIGVIIFFFVFLIAGISFLQERTSGTLEKLLSTPIKRWQIVVGYVLGFGIVMAIQACLITFFCIYVLDIMLAGNFLLVILIAILTAASALTLGILLSSIANNEFQMIQFVPIVVVPQVAFSGLFELPSSMQIFGKMMPLQYVTDALTRVMFKGAGLFDIAGDLLFLVGCSLVFMILNNLVLKRYRDI